MKGRSKMENRSPASLVSLCVQSCVRFWLQVSLPSTPTFVTKPNAEFKVQSLPPQLCERVLRGFIRHFELDIDPSTFNDAIIRIFQTGMVKSLQKLNLKNAIHLTDSTLKILMRRCRNVKEIELRGCRNLNGTFFSEIKHCSKLEMLIIGDLNNLSHVPKRLECPNLKGLVMWDWPKAKGVQHKLMSLMKGRGHLMDTFLEPVIKNLVYLDLSGCGEIKYLTTLDKASQLHSLILNDVKITPGLQRQILALKSLRILDISVSNWEKYVGDKNDATVSEIGESLKNLDDLYIYGRDSSIGNKVDSGSGSLCTENEHQMISAIKRNISRSRMLLPILHKFLKVDEVGGEEGLRKLVLFSQLLHNPLLDPLLQKAVLEGILQVLVISNTPLDRALKTDIITRVSRVVQEHYLTTQVIETAHDILIKIGNPNEIGFDFKRISDILMKIPFGPLDLHPFACLCSLRRILTLSKNPADLDYLLSLKVMKRWMRSLKELHFSQGKGCSIETINTIWDSILNMVKGSVESRKEFVQVSGPKWMSWFHQWYPQQTKLHSTFREISLELEKSAELFESSPSKKFKKQQKIHLRNLQRFDSPVQSGFENRK